MGIFNKKNRSFTFEDNKFEVKRLSADVLFEALELVMKTGLFDVLVGAGAANTATTEEEKQAVVQDIGRQAILSLRNSTQDIKAKLYDIIGDITLIVDEDGNKAKLTEEDKAEMPIEFVVRVVTEAIQTVDAQSFLATFQALLGQTKAKLETAQASTTASPIG